MNALKRLPKQAQPQVTLGKAPGEGGDVFNGKKIKTMTGAA
jgi:hypothetical protein